MNPIVPDQRMVEIMRGYITDNSTESTRPDMNDERHLITLLRLAVDECKARLPLWKLERLNRGDIKLIIDRCIAYDVPDAADLIESMVQKLVNKEVEK